MTKIAANLTDLIGNTPLLELCNFNKKNKLAATIIAKLEYFNPAGSVIFFVIDTSNPNIAKVNLNLTGLIFKC